MTAKRSGALAARANQGFESFERAMKALGKRDYARAQEILASILESHPDELDLAERVRAYRALCERALEKRPPFRPRGFDDLLHYGVYLHNRGEYEEALKCFHQAAEIHPRNEHLLYCVAASSARSGDGPGAVKALRAAITANPTCRAQARADSDFDAIREDEDFDALVYARA